jgi:DNA-binding GntR family transcriptional regulator
MKSELDRVVPTLRSTTYHRVHDAILGDIVKGVLPPGMRLKIAELCNRYGLSQMPIREALQQLQGEGIIVMSPNKGASVRPIDQRFITDIYDMRVALYSIIYRDAIAAADKAFDQKLVRIQKRFDVLMEEGDLKRCQEQNQIFHTMIETKCRNEEVAKFIRKYSDLTSSLRDIVGYDMARFRKIAEEHWRIIDAFLARDTKLAVEAAQYHETQALASMSKYFQEIILSKVLKT